MKRKILQIVKGTISSIKVCKIKIHVAQWLEHLTSYCNFLLISPLDLRPDAADKPTNEADEEDYSYTEPTGTPTSTPSPRREIHEGMKEDELDENTETGMNTQKELEEKREFFEKLEEENKSNLDYGKLNEMLDEETSATDQGKVKLC